MSSLANLIPIFGAAAAAVNEERSLTSRYVEYLAIAGGGLTGWGVGKGNGDRSCWTDPYRFHMGFWETDVVRWPAGSTNWRKKFRLSFATLRNLCTRLEPLMGKENTNFRPSIDVRKRIGMCLYYLGHGNPLHTIAEDTFKCGTSTLHCSLTDFLGHMSSGEIVREWIRLPKENELERVALDFSQLGSLKNCVGAIDGTHIPWRAQRTGLVGPFNALDYMNRKSFHSIIALACVDANRNYRSFFVGMPGSSADPHVLLRSGPLYSWIVDELPQCGELQIGGEVIPMYVVGDGIFPLLPSLMVPFGASGTRDEHRDFDKDQSRTRMPVEHVFGMTKGRWQILKTAVHCGLKRLCQICMSCAVLHNMCNQLNRDTLPEFSNAKINSELFYEEYVQPFSGHGDAPYVAANVSAGDSVEGKRVRDRLVDYLEGLEQIDE